MSADGRIPIPAGSVSIDPVVRSTSRTLSFLFTDVEGSTRLWERFPDGMRASLAQHDAVLRAAVEGAGGTVVKTTGDGVMAVFRTAGESLAACLAAQKALQRETWGETGPLRVRMGLHVGEDSGDGHDYHGPAVNRAARIMAAGHGGQVLLSGATAALVLDQLPDGASLMDLGEHRLRDLARPERVFQLVHADLPASFPPLSTSGERVSALPAEPSALVGRETELAHVVERLLDPSVRLLTLTGPGGIGKTRLALRAAREVEGRFSAGAAFVDLSAARDTNSLLTTIAREIGLADVSEESQLDELITRLAGPRLLVLDNLEQIVAAAATLAQLLQASSGLTVLATSRGPLHVRGEHLFPVPPMALPDAALRPPSAEQIQQYEAVRLFVERARAVRPDFHVTDDNAAVLAEICRRLEGLPLAIELATARLRVFSLEALHQRLGSSLRVLGSGARDLPERQQTLRATIEWSYELLTPGEQRLFEIMACFSGADVEAVEGVAGDLGRWLDGVDPIDGLSSLVDKSLLRQGDRDGAEPRFEMTRSVREYAVETLAGRPELAAQARRAHAAWYSAWVVRSVRELADAGRVAMLERLGEELENLRAAWRTSVEERAADQLEALMDGLWRLYDARGWYRASIELADDMLGVHETLPASTERTAFAVTLRSIQARALSAIHGYTAEVAAAYERLLASLPDEDVPQVFPVLRSLASLYTFRDENAKSVEVGRRILRLADLQGDPGMRGDGHLVLGMGLSFSGRLEDGLPDLESAARCFEDYPYHAMRFRLGPDPQVVTLTALSLLLWWQGRLDASLGRSEQAVAMARALDHPSTTGYALFHAGLLRLWRREPDHVREHALRAVETAEENELHIWKAVGTVLLGASAVAMGNADEGLRWIADGVDRYRDLPTPPVFWRFLLHARAIASAQAGRLDEGLAYIDEAIGQMPQMADFHIVRGDLLLASGGEAQAEHAYATALELARGWGAATPELQAAVRLCRLPGPSEEVRRGRFDALRQVLGAFTEGFEARDLVEARELLEAAGGSAPGG
jgi:predicted ATPase/class 3 adenylate cyclase